MKLSLFSDGFWVPCLVSLSLDDRCIFLYFLPGLFLFCCFIFRHYSCFFVGVYGYGFADVWYEVGIWLVHPCSPVRGQGVNGVTYLTLSLIHVKCHFFTYSVLRCLPPHSGTFPPLLTRVFLLIWCLSVPACCCFQSRQHRCIFWDQLWNYPSIVPFEKLCWLFLCVYSLGINFRVSLWDSVVCSLDLGTATGDMRWVSEGWALDVASGKQSGLWLWQEMRVWPRWSWSSHFGFPLAHGALQRRCVCWTASATPATRVRSGYELYCN